MTLMELWVILSIAAAFLQNLRSVLQKHLKARLSNWGATSARFVFAAPLAALIVAGLSLLRDTAPPTPDFVFFTYACIGGLAQIAATALLLNLFSFRNFTVGTILSKTETIQSAILGFVLLSETISGKAVFAISVSLLGLILLSLPAGVSYRAASLSLPGGDFLMRAAVTLSFVTLFQALVMCVFLALREPGQLRRLFSAWRISALAGIAGGLASFGWFAAMTLQKAVLVKAVGQIEVVFSFAASLLFFREIMRPYEAIGTVLITAGILLLILTTS